MLLELKNVKKYFPVKKGLSRGDSGFVKAVDDVSLNIKEGESISLVGESGCGKTTLARLVVKLLSADSGKILFKGKDVGCIRNDKMRILRKDMQMVFQDPYSSLDPRFTVRNILKEATGLDNNKFKTDQEKEARMHELLVAVGLAGSILNRFPHEFSGGERQRIAIARALMMNPQLVILDEAVSSLDVLVQEQIIELLNDLKKKFNLTYLFISHNLRVVKKVSTRVAVMFNGRIVELGTTEEIFNNPLHPYTKELLAAAIEYKSIERDKELLIETGANLVDVGSGHWVLKPF